MFCPRPIKNREREREREIRRRRRRRRRRRKGEKAQQQNLAETLDLAESVTAVHCGVHVETTFWLEAFRVHSSGFTSQLESAHKVGKLITEQPVFAR